jgi:hypothetical protein
MLTGAITRVSVTPTGTQGNNYSTGPFLSADGRSVAFYGLASNFVAGDVNNAHDVFVWTATPEDTGFDVQRGVAQRSFIRYLDVSLDDPATATALLGTGRVRLVRRDLAGNNPSQVALSPEALSASGGILSINFGPNGLGGNRNSTAGDGYYTLDIDLDGDGLFDASRSFYRLLGDTNGDRQVTDADVAAIQSVISANGFDLNADVNGDGVVNSTDKLLATRSRGRQLAPSLWLDD